MLKTSRKIFAGFVLAAVGISVAAAQDLPRAETKGEPGHVLVYRKGSSGKFVKPSVYWGDKEVALMYANHYFTLVLPPGKHTIGSSKENKSVTLDVQSGGKYYLKISPARSMVRAKFGVAEIDAKTALKEVGGLKPAESGHIMMPEIASISLAPGK